MVTASPPRHASYPLLLSMFIAWVIAGIVMLYVMVYVVETVFNTPFPANSSMGAILLGVAGMSTGMSWYTRELAVPSSGRKWMFALLSTVVLTALQAALLYFLVSFDPVTNADMRALLTEDIGIGLNAILIVLVVCIIFEFLMIRAAIWFGVRTAAKQQERIAAKSGR